VVLLLIRLFIYKIIILIFILTSQVYPAIINVPDDYLKIQEAIDFAENGDTVLVSNGIYTGNGNKELDFKSKAIIVKSENGPQFTIIDCENEGRGFKLQRGENRSSEIRGFTIMNGSTDKGGAVFCYRSSPTIAENIIVKSISGYGGGIYLEESEALITDNIIEENTAKSQGGAIYSGFSSPIIKNNLIADNIGRANGGAISCRRSEIQIDSNDIIENMAALCGGGIYCEEDCSLTVVNNLVVENSTFRGGGIYCWAICELKLINNTVVKNDAGFGGGIYSKQDCSLEVINSIFWENTPEQLLIDASSRISVIYSDIQDGWKGEGNLNAEPMFISPEDADYHLQKDSPCLNTAKDEYAPGKDKESNDRPLGKRTDMGCYEQAESGKFEVEPNEKSRALWGELKNSSDKTIEKY